MIRLIIRNKISNNIANFQTERLTTYDVDLPKIESILTGGGYGENGADIRELIGCEIIKAETKDGE